MRHTETNPGKHGARFRESLVKSNLSLRDLSDAIGVSREGIHHWKLRGVPAVHVVKVAALLGCEVSFLRPDVYYDIDDRR